MMHLAYLAGRSFTSERASTQFPYQVDNDLPAKPLAAPLGQAWLCVPRRPKWSRDLDAASFQKLEHLAFLEWRRSLAVVEDSGHFIITPFERNLEIWRQLWRVVESCRVIIQIVDARNPLMFYCEDLKSYAQEVCEYKEFVLLINKADFLHDDQRVIWSEYLTKKGLKFAFYSAKAAPNEEELPGDGEFFSLNSPKILSNTQLLGLLKRISSDDKVGFVGYPNVGKSSTINSLATAKKVAVSATPGKTKHYQTVLLPNGVVVLDCPGLVFPNLAASKSELILNGILPIDQLREWITPVTLLLKYVPRDILERIYNIDLLKRSEDQEPLEPTASDFLSTYALARGFSTSFHGNPDESRAARVVLKDFVSGKICCCIPPPGLDSESFNHTLWGEIRNNYECKPKINYAYAPLGDVRITALATGMAHVSSVAGSTAPVSKQSKNTSKKHFKKDRKRCGI